MPALLIIINEFENVKLLFLGQFNLQALNEFSYRIINKPFFDCHELPEIISNIDINIKWFYSNYFYKNKFIFWYLILNIIYINKFKK